MSWQPNSSCVCGLPTNTPNTPKPKTSHGYPRTSTMKCKPSSANRVVHAVPADRNRPFTRPVPAGSGPNRSRPRLLLFDVRRTRAGSHWASPVEGRGLCGLLIVLVFLMDGWDATEGGVDAGCVVPVHTTHYRPAGFGPGGVAAALEALAFEGRPERLADGVVETHRRAAC